MTENPKKIIGITGGIASGKSAVANEFARLGCAIIDADDIVSSLLEDENVISKLKNALGEEIAGSDGKIDRYNMAEVVFRSKENVELTNSIIHPLVLKQAESLIESVDLGREVLGVAGTIDNPLSLVLDQRSEVVRQRIVALWFVAVVAAFRF